MKRLMLLFRDEAARGEPDEVCAFVMFDEGGDILGHTGNDHAYCFAYLLGSDFSEQLVARRCGDDPLDPCVVVSRVLKGAEAIRDGLQEDERAWARYEKQLERECMASEIARAAQR